MKNLTTKQIVTTLKNNVQVGDLLKVLCNGLEVSTFVTKVNENSIEARLTIFNNYHTEGYTSIVKYSNNGFKFWGGAKGLTQKDKDNNKIIGFINFNKYLTIKK
jgi:uncharacterized protein YkvS